jgi:hypothetical protein
MARLQSIVLALVLSAVAATPAVAAPKKNPKSPGETSAYWSAKRMENAKPRDRAKPGGGGGGGKVTDWSRYAVPLSGGSYAGENRKNGKVFMTIDGADYVCSGTAVAASAGVNLVWTAGHCVTDGPGHEATNLMFVPGYYRGAAPNGRWTFTSLDSTAGWEAQGPDRWRHDVGAARVVNTTNASATFEGTIGTRPISFGVSPVGKRLVAYGYPASGRFNGSQQYACASPFRRWDVVASLDPMQISCDMTGGSSGGGWILDSNANSTGDAGEPVVSVNSYGYPGEKSTMYGPYMSAGGQAEALYDSLK